MLYHTMLTTIFWVKPEKPRNIFPTNDRTVPAVPILASESPPDSDCDPSLGHELDRNFIEFSLLETLIVVSHSHSMP